MWRLGINPLLHLNDARAVIDLVGCVCGLLDDVADLPDEGALGDFAAVDEEFAIGVWLLGVDKLFDCYGAEGVVSELCMSVTI